MFCVYWDVNPLSDNRRFYTFFISRLNHSYCERNAQEANFHWHAHGSRVNEWPVLSFAGRASELVTDLLYSSWILCTSTLPVIQQP